MNLAKSIRVAIALLLVTCGASAHAAAQRPYPARPVTIVVPFGPGTSLDLLGRLIASHMQASFGQPFVVENRPGVGGVLGASGVARAAGDGYTLLVTTSSTHSAVKGLYKQIPYDPLRDFAPIAKFARLSPVLVVNPGQSISSPQEFLAYAKANPGRLDVGYGNSSGQIAAEMLKKNANIDLVRVSYKSNVQVITDLVGGHIKAAAVDLFTPAAYIHTGKLHAVAMLSRERSSFFAHVPTLHETILPGFDLSAWAGIFSAPQTPPEIVEMLSLEIRKFILRPDVKEQFTKIAFDAEWVGPADFLRFLALELDRWTEMTAAAGIQPQ